jgi:hypothetical protein
MPLMLPANDDDRDTPGREDEEEPAAAGRDDDAAVVDESRTGADGSDAVRVVVRGDGVVDDVM